MEWSKLQVQLTGYAIAILSIAYSFWEGSKLIFESGGMTAVLAAWAVGPLSMTTAGLSAAMSTGNWSLLLSLFIGVPVGLIVIVAGHSMSGSGL